MDDADIEAGSKTIGQLVYGCNIDIAGSVDAQYCVDHQTDDASGNGGVPHGFDVIKQRNITGRGRQQGCVGQRTHFVAKERTRNDRASSHCNGDTQTISHATQNNTDGADGTPTGTCTDSHKSRQDKADGQKQFRGDDF